MAFNLRTFLLLLAGFVGLVVIGALLVMAGIYLTGRLLGLDIHITYFYFWVDKQRTIRDVVLIRSIPMIFTMLIGTMGLLRLFLHRKSFQNQSTLSIKQWVMIFVTLFWLRQTFALVYLFTRFLMNLLFHYGSSQAAITILTGLMGIGVFALVFFRFVPPSQRLMFLLAAGIGSAFGCVIWFNVAGPVLLPNPIMHPCSVR